MKADVKRTILTSDDTGQQRDLSEKLVNFGKKLRLFVACWTYWTYVIVGFSDVSDNLHVKMHFIRDTFCYFCDKNIGNPPYFEHYE